jgi:hypothetical protein
VPGTRLDDLPDSDVVSLPVDHLALVVLRHLVETDEWNAHNFRNSQHHRGRKDDALRALAEAFGWLVGHNLVVYGKPGQSSAEAIFVSRAGHEAARDGFAKLRAGERLIADLDSRLLRTRTLFLLGEYEAAALLSMREVEIAIRKKIRAPESLVGT